MTGRSAGLLTGPVAARVLAAFVALPLAGVVAGVLWEWVWTPPQGVVLRRRWVQDPAGLAADFSATGWYVVIAFVAGAGVAAALAWLLPGHELATMLAVAVAGMVAGWLMYHVGHALGPADPVVLARTAERGTVLPDNLTLGGLDQAPRFLRLDPSAVLAFPAGALLGLAATALTTDGRVRRRASQGPR
jgi:hypothetical protein